MATFPGQRLHGRIAFLAACALSTSACTYRGPNLSATEPRRTPTPQIDLPKLPIDAVGSPLAFQWLGSEAVLIDGKTGTRTLAGFGNYLAGAAKDVHRARLSIWDDQAAWKRAGTPEGSSKELLAHRRAEYLKEERPEPIEQFTVFEADGKVAYERDFRDWPITEFDAPD